MVYCNTKYIVIFYSVYFVCLHSELCITASPACYFLLFWMFIAVRNIRDRIGPCLGSGPHWSNMGSAHFSTFFGLALPAQSPCSSFSAYSDQSRESESPWVWVLAQSWSWSQESPFWVRLRLRARTAPWLYIEPSTMLFQPVYSPG